MIYVYMYLTYLVAMHPIYNTIPNFANMEREFQEEFMRQTA
jgi:hypothetical protein